jgi:hypothetical protein
METPYRTLIGRVTFNSIQRRLAVWLALNLMFSIFLFIALNILYAYKARLFDTKPKFKTDLTSFLVYFATCCALLTLTYLLYVADSGNFGGTAIKQNVFGRWIRQLFLIFSTGLVFSKCYRDIFSSLGSSELSIGVLTTWSLSTYLKSTIAGVLAAHWYLSRPKDYPMLQATPGPVFVTFLGNVAASVSCAARRSAMVTLSTTSVVLLVHFLLQRLTSIAAVNTALPPPVAAFIAVLLSSTSATSSYSIYADVWMGFLLSMLLQVHLEVMSASLSFVATYPMDFALLAYSLSKQQEQQKQRYAAASSSSGALMSTSTSSSSRLPSSDADVEEQKAEKETLLITALALGCVNPESNEGSSNERNQGGASFSGASGGGGGGLKQKNKFLDIGSRNYHENVALRQARAQEQRQTQLLSTISSSYFEPSLVAGFGESNEQSRAHKNILLGSKDALSSHLFLEKFDLLARSLALQDLHRLTCDPSTITSASSDESKSVVDTNGVAASYSRSRGPSSEQDNLAYCFTDEARQRRGLLYKYHWQSLVSSLCGLLEAAAVQVFFWAFELSMLIVFQSFIYFVFIYVVVICY